MIKRISLWTISIYRRWLSPFIGGQCRYHPTCSLYAEQAINRHGPIKGWILAVLRIMNCHPWSRRSWSDPVPERFVWPHIIGYKRRDCPEENE